MRVTLYFYWLEKRIKILIIKGHGLGTKRCMDKSTNGIFYTRCYRHSSTVLEKVGLGMVKNRS
ncbi:MAG: hypothetical protein CM1200mP10_25960 [Candidatus Neomarinimicrobiota bacterium]|nr:MAG: hypothetical protein CM1200mP10_25960 [Candidatus Neomarinimicrobiota bacterium]